MLTQLYPLFSSSLFPLKMPLKKACLINTSQKLTPVKLTLDRN